MRQEDISQKKAAEKNKKRRRPSENLGDLKERAGATLLFLPNEVVPPEEKIKIKEGINNSSNKEEFSMAMKKLYETIKRTRGEGDAKRIVAGILR